MDDMEFSLSDLKFPAMRQELISALEVLSDIEAHERRANCPGNFKDPFDGRLITALHFIFDDTNLEDDPERHIGFFLTDISEAEAIKELAIVLDTLLEEPGKTIDSKRILRNQKWGRVVELASDALAHLKAKRISHSGD